MRKRDNYMNELTIGQVIYKKRKELGFTQTSLAELLNVSFQAVSKWENGTSTPEITLLPMIAKTLGCSIDSLLGHSTEVASDYEQRYKKNGYYWGLNPNYLCYELMQKMPPIKPLKVLDIGCGEGKDAVFLARNGYKVTAFDIAESGLAKGRELAERNGTYVDFFKADINDFELTDDYDIIFCSGVLHYIEPMKRNEFVQKVRSHTKLGGLNIINVFVEKPYIRNHESKKISHLWKSGELFTHFYDWKFHTMEEFMFDCNSGGVPHQHCMNVMIAKKVCEP